MQIINEEIERLEYRQFPVVLALLCIGLFVLFWFLALVIETGLKPLHYTLFNFLLVAILALQKYHRLEISAVSGEYRLVSIGLLSGVKHWSGSIDEVSGLYMEPGFGGVKGSGGRLLLQRHDQPALVLSSTDILPGSSRQLKSVATTIEKWLSQQKGAVK